MQVFWFIPTHGDARYLGSSEGARQLSHDYVKQVAVAADSLGYEGVLIPTGRSCEDPWVVASSLLPVTKRLKYRQEKLERRLHLLESKPSTGSLQSDRCVLQQ